MSQFDVCALKTDARLVLDVQADALSALPTRVVVPLILWKEYDGQSGTLNPVFHLNEEDYILLTQFPTTLEKRKLTAPVANLESERYDIMKALDMLISGF